MCCVRRRVSEPTLELLVQVKREKAGSPQSPAAPRPVAAQKSQGREDTALHPSLCTAALAPMPAGGGGPLPGWNPCLSPACSSPALSRVASQALPIAPPPLGDCTDLWPCPGHVVCLSSMGREVSLAGLAVRCLWPPVSHWLITASLGTTGLLALLPWRLCLAFRSLTFAAISGEKGSPHLLSPFCVQAFCILFLWSHAIL